MKKIAIVLTLSALALPTFAQSFDDRAEPQGSSPIYGHIDPVTTLGGSSGGCSCTQPIPAARTSHTFDVGQRDEPVDVFNPISARDALATFRNLGDGAESIR